MMIVIRCLLISEVALIPYFALRTPFWWVAPILVFMLPFLNMGLLRLAEPPTVRLSLVKFYQRVWDSMHWSYSEPTRRSRARPRSRSLYSPWVDSQIAEAERYPWGLLTLGVIGPLIAVVRLPVAAYVYGSLTANILWANKIAALLVGAAVVSGLWFVYKGCDGVMTSRMKSPPGPTQYLLEGRVT